MDVIVTPEVRDHIVTRLADAEAKLDERASQLISELQDHSSKTAACLLAVDIVNGAVRRLRKAGLKIGTA